MPEDLHAPACIVHVGEVVNRGQQQKGTGRSRGVGIVCGAEPEQVAGGLSVDESGAGDDGCGILRVGKRHYAVMA